LFKLNYQRKQRGMTYQLTPTECRLHNWQETKTGQTVRHLDSTNQKKNNKSMLSCLRVAQVICESLQFVSFEVVVVSQHKVLHRTPRPPALP
jgi:hypothetical protein